MEGYEMCMWGHVADEHGGDPKFPGSTKCTVDDCDCLCFDLDEEDED